MINQQILQNTVKDKIANMCLHAIVNECFIPALPFDMDDLTPDDRRALTIYSKGVLESVITEDGKRGAIPLLERAIETATDPRKKQFLTSIYTICAETAVKVADRVKKDADNGVSLEEILDNAGLNKDEIKEFNDNVTAINPNKISEKIQDKVIDTIKSEQKAHQDAEEMNERLKEMLTPKPEENENDDGYDEEDIAEDGASDKKSTENDEEMEEDEEGIDEEENFSDEGEEDNSEGENDTEDEGEDGKDGDEDGEDNIDSNETEDDSNSSEESKGDDKDAKDKKSKKKEKDDKEEIEKEKAVESWMNFHYGKLGVKAPISLFSKLQDFAMEAILTTDETTYGDIPYDALTKMTYMAPISFIYTEPSLETAVESLLSIDERQEIAMESSVPEITGETIDKSMIISTIVYTILETLKTLNLYSPTQNQVRSTVHAPNTYVNSQNQELEIAKDQLERKVNDIKTAATKNSTRVGLMTAAESIDYCRYAIEQLTKKYPSFESVSEKLTPKLDHYEKIINEKIGTKTVATEAALKQTNDRKNAVVLEFNKLNRYFNKPNIDRIEIHYNSKAIESYVPDVIVRDNFGNIADRSFLDFEVPEHFGLGMENVLRLAYPLSKIAESNKMIQIIDHGRAYKTENLV